MVVGAFPAAKLGALLLKQISKPIANVMKEQAKTSPVFRKYICMPPAQFYNWCEVKAKMWILNLGKPVNIPVLNEAMAIELGANILGEGIIFLIAAGIVVSEYNRSSRKETAKEEAKLQEKAQIQNAITELFIQSEEQAAQLRELMRKLGDLDTRIGNSEISPGSRSPAQPSPRPPTIVLPSQEPPANVPPSLPSERPSTDTPPVPVPPAYVPNSEHSSEGLPTSKYDLSQHTVRYSDSNSNKRNNFSVDNSLILKAVEDVGNQFWNSPLIERDTSIIILAVYYVNQLLKFQQ